jgi:hypothetical protein
VFSIRLLRYFLPQFHRRYSFFHFNTWENIADVVFAVFARLHNIKRAARRLEQQLEQSIRVLVTVLLSEVLDTDGYGGPAPGLEQVGSWLIHVPEPSPLMNQGLLYWVLMKK